MGDPGLDVEPGSIDTPIWQRGEASADETLAGSPRMRELYGAAIERYRKVIRDTAERGIPPEKVAAKIQHALEARRPRTRYLIGIDAQVQGRLMPHPPDPAGRPHRRRLHGLPEAARRGFLSARRAPKSPRAPILTT